MTTNFAALASAASATHTRFGIHSTGSVRAESPDPAGLRFALHYWHFNFEEKRNCMACTVDVLRGVPLFSSLDHDELRVSR